MAIERVNGIAIDLMDDGTNITTNNDPPTLR